MIVHYVIYSIMAALSLVAVYAAAIPIHKKTPAEQQEAEKLMGRPLTRNDVGRWRGYWIGEIGSKYEVGLSPVLIYPTVKWN